MMPPVDLSAIAEQLCRIEHKIDLIVEFLAMTNPEFQLRSLTDPSNRDPLTQEQVTFWMDLFKRHVVRKASDGTGLIPPSPVLFEPNTPTNTGKTNVGNEGNSDAG